MGFTHLVATTPRIWAVSANDVEILMFGFVISRSELR